MPANKPQQSNSNPKTDRSEEIKALQQRWEKKNRQQQASPLQTPRTEPGNTPAAKKNGSQAPE